MMENKVVSLGEFGVLEKIVSNSVPKLKSIKPSEDINSLTMENFVLAFLILLFGLSISICVFVFEVIRNRL